MSEEKIKSVINFANSVLLVDEILRHLREPTKVTVHARYRSRYVYGNTETNDIEIYTIPDDIREMLAEYFEYVLNDFTMMVKIHNKLHRIAKLILPALELAEPVRRYSDSNGDDRNHYTENYYIYEVMTPYVIKYYVERNGRKYVNIVFKTEPLIDNDVADVFEAIDKAVETARNHCPDISNSALEKFLRYVENGYKVVDWHIYNTLTLKVGSMQTEIADLQASYEVLCGEVEEEVGEREEDNFSSYMYIKITPKTNAIIVYKKFYSHGWDTKEIYFLRP